MEITQGPTRQTVQIQVQRGVHDERKLAVEAGRAAQKGPSGGSDKIKQIPVNRHPRPATPKQKPTRRVGFDHEDGIAMRQTKGGTKDVESDFPGSNPGEGRGDVDRRDSLEIDMAVARKTS